MSRLQLILRSLGIVSSPETPHRSKVTRGRPQKASKRRLPRKSTRRRGAGRKTRRGAIVVLIALCLAVVLTFVAIAIDGGGLLERRRQSQNAADAAALAAAERLFFNYPKAKGVDAGGTAVSRALAIAAANGFNNDGTRSTVDVRTYPQAYSG